MADYESPKVTPEQRAEFLRRALRNLKAGNYDKSAFPPALVQQIEAMQQQEENTSPLGDRGAAAASIYNRNQR